MNKIILSLPKPILQRHVLKHFSTLSVGDFFQVIKKVEIPVYYFKENDTLNKSPDVLSYMLDIDKNAFEYFAPSALTPECVNKIANSGVKIYPNHIDVYPMLLENNIICETVIQSFPKVFKKLSESHVTENIISILENSYYIPDEEDINKSSLFLKNEVLMERAITLNPMLFLRLEEPSDRLVYTALYHGFIPERRHFIDYPYLKTKNFLIRKAFESDPSVIVYFEKEQLTFKTIMSARERGYIASEQDLLENPNLCNADFIMEDAIRNNPKFITLMGEFCQIDFTLLVDALKKYKITKQDLERNPALTRNFTFISMLPDFSLYSAYLTDEEKEKAIANVLKKSHILTTDSLPFLDRKFGGKTDIDSINELLSYLNLSIDEDYLDIQRDYLQLLDKIIDGVVNIRYTGNKFLFKFPDIVALHDSLIQLFHSVSITKKYELILDYVKELYFFIGETVSIEK